MATSSHRKLCAFLVAFTTAGTIGFAQQALAFDSIRDVQQAVRRNQPLAPICQQEGQTCGPLSLHMTCQRQGTGSALQCRKAQIR